MKVKNLSQEEIINQKREKAIEMVGKKIEMQIVNKAISIDKEKHQVTFVMSTENIDRHGEIVDQASWILKYFQESPMFFFQHKSDEFPLGKWVKIWSEADPDNIGKQRLVGTAEFRVEFEDAMRAFRHVEEGDMSAVSVGFIPNRVEYDEVLDTFVLYDCELLECSLVGVGSNRQALSKSKDEEINNLKEDAINLKKELDEKIKASNNTVIIAHLKARESINKAIRKLNISVH